MQWVIDEGDEWMEEVESKLRMWGKVMLKPTALYTSLKYNFKNRVSRELTSMNIAALAVIKQKKMLSG